MIVVVGGVKGGSGKTTLATNLTVLMAKKSKVLLIDSDEQKSSFDWASQRQMLGRKSSWNTIMLRGKSMYKDVLKLSENYDHVIIDAGGHDSYSQRSCLTIADIFLIPFRPRSLDIWTLDQIQELIKDVSSINPKMKNQAVINQADSSGKDNRDAKNAILQYKDIKCLDTFIINRKSFSCASSLGLAVEEYRPLDEKATFEMNCVYKEICG